MKYYTLNDGLKIPAVGLGTSAIKEYEEMEFTLCKAIELGYEYIDTARRYNNEHLIGDVIKNHNIKRESIMIGTKVRPSYYESDKTKISIEKSLKALRTDYLDVVHLHRFGKRFDEAWKVLLDYKDQGIIKSVAVSNFMPEHLEKLFEISDVIPSMDQLEGHIHLKDLDTRKYLKEKTIKHQARMPLGRLRGDMLDEEIIKEIARKHDKTPAQIILRWNLEEDSMIIPKSVHEEFLRDNIETTNFSLDDEDMKKIMSIDKNINYGPSPRDEQWLKEAGESI